MTSETIFENVAAQISDLFGIDRARITRESRFEEMDITSIDAIDLIVELQRMLGKKLPEQSLRKLRTVGDVVVLVEQHLPGAVPNGSADAA